MATWPATLPYPKSDGYTLSPLDQTIRTDMEFGPARARRRSMAKNDKLGVSWLFNDAQMAIFRAWYDSDTDAGGGANWFDVSVKTGEGGISAKVCRFSGIWNATLQSGGFWLVTASLEVR